MILPPYGNPADRSLGRVVVQGHAGVIDKARQSRPELARVRDRLAQGRLRQRALQEQPSLDLLNDQFRLLLANGLPLTLRHK